VKNKRVGYLLSAACALLLSACGESGRPEDVELTQGALVDPAAVLGFENTTSWSVTTGAKSSTTDRTQGAAALAVQNFSYVELRSAQLSTLSGVTATLAFDLKLPVSPAWGQAQMFVSIPSRNVYNAPVGQVALAGAPALVYRELTFTVPQAIVDALKQAYSDLTFTIALNVPQTSAAYKVDNLRFKGGSTAPNKVELRVSGVDDFIYVTVNGVQRKIFYIGDPDVGVRKDVSAWFAGGANDVRLQAINTGGPVTYGIEMWVDGTQVVNEVCPATLCNGAEQPAGMLLNRTVAIQTPNLPARQTVSVANSTGGKIYLNDVYTGLSAPASLPLPQGQYTLAVGISTDAPFAYTGSYREQSVTVGSSAVSVNFSSTPAVPLVDTHRILIIPIRQAYSPDASNVGILQDSDVTAFQAQVNATRDVWFRPFTFGLATWDITVHPMVEDTPIYLPSSQSPADDATFRAQSGLEGIQNQYDIVCYYFSQHRADGSPVNNASGYAWGTFRYISINTTMTRGRVNDSPNPYFLHESLHNYEADNDWNYHVYNGVGGVHGAGTHGYRSEENAGETDFVKFYRLLIRGQVADLAGMRAGTDWPSVPTTADLWTGLFPVIRHGFTPNTTP
jgi:hypothetical protein